LNGRTELIVLDGFLHATVSAELITLGQLARVRSGSQNHHRNHTGAGICPDAAENLETVQLGQLQVEQDEAGQGSRKAVPEATSPQQEIQGLLAITRHFNPGIRPDVAQWAKSELELQGMVFDQEDVGWNRVGG
jgi:hypothetical protein